jgi:hypothetical protein
MPSSRIPGPLCGSKRGHRFYTPGPLGVNDQADPEVATRADAVGAPLGANTCNAAIGLVAIRPTNSVSSETPGAAENDPEIEALNLSPIARKGAYLLKQIHACVKFTSGRRTKEDQARAMAGNVVENRKWIEETYRKTSITTRCQKWVDENPDRKTHKEIQEGLLSVFNCVSPAELGELSKHLSGDAFDVQPVEKDADAIKQTIRDLPGRETFLDKEGGLVRWHVHFQ